MRKGLRTLLITLALSQSGFIFADSLKPFRATYSAKLDGGLAISADATRELKQLEDGGWVFTSTADAVLARQHEKSQFTYLDEQIHPLSYSYQREVLGRERRVKLAFNWKKQRVTTTVDDKPWHMQIPPGTQDKLSYQLQLRRDLAEGNTALRYDVADGGLLSEYIFKVLGEESIETRAGTFNAIKVERVREEGSGRTTYIWFAPDLEYLIVKLYQTESDGKEYELLLNQLENR
ncbi:Enzyme involved in the deoxyxylulose pathway of isoprenoid biosynthesis [Marinobacterium lacunae]|uniref:Enzyme involved in the deoxyxylulose pathway of isoprenoid biosynthesis n=1 Tax=Marinobacterium lacunae TaxID=1232683 RepID=A0A081FW21_9GAMM|nr:DUF3108 domain-containing protein [Marinobacterium lacunae]KEA62726.1 Enzyme involved in the deoxyxylulose pathway of isoprenoid biosynthesis [Marinobacterium lacunae]